MKRLWTLQEATLASEAHGVERLYFQMRGGPFLYQKYDRDKRLFRGIGKNTTEIQAEERVLLLERGVMLELGAQIPSVRGMRDMRTGWSPFRVAYSALEHRSTSKVEDVPVCIASLLGKDVSTILSAETAEQRMVNFYMLMREVPSGVIWCNTTQKLSIKPFCWALSSITACGMSTYMGWEDGICDSSGLHVRYRGFIFSQKKATEKSNEENEEAATKFPAISNIVSVETGNVLGTLRGRPSPVIPMQQHLALIFRPIDRGALDPSTAVVAVENTIEYDEEGGAKSTELVCSIVGYADLLPARGVHESEFLGYMTATDQRWCIT